MTSPPSPHARGTRTRPAPNVRPHEWHSYSGPRPRDDARLERLERLRHVAPLLRERLPLRDVEGAQLLGLDRPRLEAGGPTGLGRRRVEVDRHPEEVPHVAVAARLEQAQAGF